MKYIKFIIIFLVFTIVAYNVYDFDLQTESQNYNLDEQNIQDININVTNAKINIEQTSQSDILIERVYSEGSDESKKVYFNMNKEAGEVYVGEYVMQNKDVKPNQTINIKIPANIEELNVNIVGENNQVVLDAVGLNKLTVNDTDDLSIEATNVAIDDAQIQSSEIVADISDYEGNDFNINADVLDVTLDNLNVVNSNIYGLSGKVVVLESAINNFAMDTDNVQFTMYLGKDKSYNITSSKEIKSKSLTKTKDYNYVYNENSEHYNYEIKTNNKINIKE